MSQGLPRLEQQGKPPGRRQQSGKGCCRSTTLTMCPIGQHLCREQWVLGGDGCTQQPPAPAPRAVLATVVQQMEFQEVTGSCWGAGVCLCCRRFAAPKRGVEEG